MTTVAVVIPTYRRPGMVEDLLESLARGTRLPDEVIAVETGGGGKIDPARCPELPLRMVSLNAGSAHVATARNAGWRASSAELIFFVDDDNLVGESTLETLAAAGSDPTIGVVAPVSYSSEERGFVWCGGVRRSMWTTRTTYLYRGRGRLPEEELWETADMPNAFAIPRAVLEQCGGFDAELFPMHFEEGDLMMRIRALGLRTVVARSGAVFHHIAANTSAGGLPGKEILRALSAGGPARVKALGRSRIRFHRKYGTRPQRALTTGLCIPLWATVSTLACAATPATPAQRLLAIRSLWSGLIEGYRRVDQAGSSAWRAGDGDSPQQASRLGLLTLLARLRRTLRNWQLVAPLAFIVGPSRLPPRGGALRWPISHRPVTLRLRNGMTLKCALNEFLGFFDVFVLEEYEIPDLDWSQVQTVIDVGANVGAATLWFCSRAPAARVIAVEPGPAAASRCADNVKRNGLANRASVREVALGPAPGSAYYRKGPKSLTATVKPTRADPYDIRVAVIGLAQLMAEEGLGSVDVLKMDCEGSEYEILLATQPEDLSRIGAIVGEYHQVSARQADKLWRHLQSAGFAVRQRANVSQRLFVAQKTAPPRDEPCPRGDLWT